MNTQADKSVEGMKLPTTEPGRDMCGGAGAAVGIGMEEGHLCGSIVCSLLEEKGCGVSKQIVGEAEINRKWGVKRNR